LKEEQMAHFPHTAGQLARLYCVLGYADSHAGISCCAALIESEFPDADGLQLIVDELAALFVDELECQTGMEAEFAAARAAEHDLSESMHPPP
jgi:hypothetical protein